MVKEENRCATGIPGFDNLCLGGLYKNSVTAVLGGPGSGKTTFLMQFLYNGITQFNENGLYISFEAHDEDFYGDAKSYGWNFEKFTQDNTLKFLRIFPDTTVDDIEKKILKVIQLMKVKRVCIDPIGILSLRLKEEHLIREKIYELTAMLKRLNITTVIADETQEGSIEYTGSKTEEARTQSIKFLSDSLINFYSSGIGGESDRALRITKMRRTNHQRGPIPFKITDKGIVVSSKK